MIRITLLFTFLFSSTIYFAQSPVFIDSAKDTASWDQDRKKEARERLKQKLYKDSIEYYKNLELLKPKVQTPKIEFNASSEIKNASLKIWMDKELIVDTIIQPEEILLGPFDAEHFYDIEVSAKDYVTKKIFVSTLGALDEAKLVRVDINPSMHLKKEFKGLKKFNPFDRPVAKVMPSETGALTFDLEYIQERKDVIEGCRKKKYKQ